MRSNMKVVVTYENGEVFPHFGRNPNIKIYDIEGKNTLVNDRREIQWQRY